MLPSNRIVASDGGLPGCSLLPNVPGATTRGRGRSSSCTRHRLFGNRGVSVKPVGGFSSPARTAATATSSVPTTAIRAMRVLGLIDLSR
ncbi:MAG: hypothetical protein QM741_02515 [Rudaea sp.]|uniref:hypothetical protein n=1 Tax=Rudaea sp. TaxID=2136325 RepID=UPI0039E3079F